MQYRLFAIIAFAATAVAYPQSDIPVRDVAASGNDVKTAVMPSVGTPTTMDNKGPQIVPIDTKEPTKTSPDDGKMSILPFSGNNNGTRPSRPPGRPMFPGIKNNGTDAGFCIELSGMPKMGKMGGMNPKNRGGPKLSDVKSIETRDNHKGDDSDDEDDKKMPNVKMASKDFQPKGQNGKWGGMDKGERGGMGGRGRRGFGRKMRSVRCVRYAEAKCAGSEVKKGTKDVKAKSIKCTRKKMAGGMRGGMKKGSKWGKPKNGTSDVKIQAREFEDDEAAFDIEDDLEDEEIEELEGRSIPLF